MKLAELVGQLTVAELQPQVFASGNGGAVVVTPHGARVLGVFTHEGAENLFYVNSELSSAATAKKFLEGEHVLGGDRLWIAPERGVFFKGAKLDDGVTTPRSIDPGEYRIGRLTGDSIRLVNEIHATYYLSPGSTLRAVVERSIRMAPSPFADFPAVLPALKGVKYAGYEIASRFELLESPQDGLSFGMWFLIQLAMPVDGGGGHLYVPTLGRTVITDYYEPTGADYLRVEENHVRFKLDSKQRHKIGIRKTEVTGRAAYLSNADAGGKATLVVRNFLNNPSANYADVPLHTPSGTQDSVQSYNHFSGPGGFGELEYHAPGVNRAAAEPVVYDTNQVWCFTGRREDLVAVASRLLGLPSSTFAL